MTEKRKKNREIEEHSSRETDLRNPPDPVANACEDGPWRQTEVNQNTIDTPDMEFVKNFTHPDFQAKSFTPQKCVICDSFFGN